MVNSRRITLGGISTNRRQSLTVGIDGPIKPSAGSRSQRMSLAPRMVGSSTAFSERTSLTPGRRKSVGESHRMSSIPPPTTMRTDNRPIGDKAYFNSCVKKLYQYLHENDYEHPIKLKDLSKPSGKDFHSIMTFLMRKIDSNFNSSIKRKFEDDVVTAFKILGYPFNISKTALVAAGSPHTWPTLLLAITWLIEVLEGRTGFGFLLDHDSEDLSSVGEAGVPFVDADTLEQRSEKAFLKYVEVSYNSFLSGDDERLEKLEVDLLQYFEKDNIMIEKEIEKMVDENSAIEEEILKNQKSSEDLPLRQKNLEELANDIEKFDMLIKQLTEHKAALVQKVQDCSSQLKEKEDELERKQAKINHLKSIVQTQEYTKEDIQRLENEKADIEEKIRQARKMKEEVENSTLQKALSVKKMCDELIKVAEQFNEKIGALMPHKEQASSFMISIRKDLLQENDQISFLGGVDIKGVLTPSWLKEKQLLVQNCAQLHRESFDLAEKKQEMEGMISEVNRDIEMIVAHKKRAVNIQTSEKDDQEHLLKEKQNDLSHLRQKVSSLQDDESFNRSLSELRDQIKELEKVRKEYQDANQVTKQAVLKEFNEFIAYCVELQDFQKTVLDELVEYVESQDPLVVTLSPSDEDLLGL